MARISQYILSMMHNTQRAMENLNEYQRNHRGVVPEGMNGNANQEERAMYQCPKCTKSEELYISATRTVIAYINAEGDVMDSTDEAGLEWDGDYCAGCSSCDWNGSVSEMEVYQE